MLKKTIVMTKKKFVRFTVLSLLVLVMLKVAASLFGIGISFPPNECDLRTGYDVYGDQIFPVRDRCLLDLARKEQNADICHNLGAYLRDDCIRDVAVFETKDVSLCRRLAGYDKAMCIEEIAEITRDKELCYEIRADRYLWEKCKAAVLGGIARDEITFIGTITDMQADSGDNCFFRETVCKLKVDDKWVIVSDPSIRIGEDVPAAGSFDIDFRLGGNVYIGKKVRVYARMIDSHTYTLYGGEYEIRQLPSQ